MPFQAVPFALGTAGVAAVGTGAWHVLTGNSCESWRTCAGSRKGHSLVPDRSGAEIATSLYHQTGPGHGNVHGVDNHTGPLPGARPPHPASRPSSLSRGGTVPRSRPFPHAAGLCAVPAARAGCADGGER